MSTEAREPAETVAFTVDDELVRLGRDAATTKRALIRAARRRFATGGYRATTVREIAGDVGVNVALINRYFASKEGLFEACMQRTSNELNELNERDEQAARNDQAARPSSDQPGTSDGLDDALPRRVASLDGLIERLISHVVNAPNSDDPLQLLLLLRSSGDENADRIRRATLESFTKRLAAAAGWSPDDESTAPTLLRAQIAIATMVGVVMMRTSAATQPMMSAQADELSVPLSQVFHALLAEDAR